MCLKPASKAPQRTFKESFRLPRMTHWLVLSMVLFAVAMYVASAHPGSLVAVSLYKVHMVSLAGWCAYWLDRALFPYARPHDFLAEEDSGFAPTAPLGQEHAELIVGESLFASIAGLVMLRRALVTLGVLLCIGLGA